MSLKCIFLNYKYVNYYYASFWMAMHLGRLYCVEELKLGTFYESLLKKSYYRIIDSLENWEKFREQIFTITVGQQKILYYSELPDKKIFLFLWDLTVLSVFLMHVCRSNEFFVSL